MDETFSLDILYTNDEIPNELYGLIQQNLCSQLDTRLRELPNPIEYLSTLTWRSQGQLSLLMAAALKGYDDIVRVLLTHCDPIHQIELKGQVIISDEICIDGATALYCACYRGHFTVAKTLIEFGKANANQTTDDFPYHPLLIHASKLDRLDIIRFLVDNKYADVNETKAGTSDQCNALIFAAYRGYIPLIEYLIDQGADVNYTCGCEQTTVITPMSVATLGGHVEAIRLLYEAGANINIRNDTGRAVLMMTVEGQHYYIINFLLERYIITVDDLELGACSLIDVSSSIEEMHDVLECLRIGLQRRKLINVPKVCIESIAAYDFKQECQTVAELDEIKDDRDRIFIETLLIRERIFLLQKDIAIMKPLHDYGDMLVEREEFDKCLNVWIHMFYLYQQIKLHTILHRFVWLFCRMLEANQIIPVDRFLQVCQLIFEPSQIQEKHCALNNALYLVIIAIKILKQEGITKEEQRAIYRWIKDLCQLPLTNNDGKTLLHLCVDVQIKKEITFRSRDILPFIEFPNASVLRLLLACGNRWLDLDAIESSMRNTPLHIICHGKKDRQIIELLLDYGCHIDGVNKYGKTPVDYVVNKEIRALLIRKRTPPNLKCLCARIIGTERLNPESLVTPTSTLNKFIILHSGDSHIQSNSF